MRNQPLTLPKELKEYLSYDPNTGDLTWIKKPAWFIKVGDTAGCVDTNLKWNKQYYVVRFRYKKYRAHRIAWFLKTGKQPEDEIDHIDGDGLNNRWDNLRNATNVENSRNCPKPINNTSGYKGVSWYPRTNKWVAYIGYKGKRINLGYFDDPELAHIAYCEAANELHKEFANYGTDL